MIAVETRLGERLNRHESAGLTRVRVARAAATAEGERPLVNFASNDYLALSSDPRVVEALCRGARQYGVGAGAADLVSGHTTAHEQLEADLARFTGRERALLFSTGYMANLSVLSTLCARGSAILEDRLNHASLIDAAVLARARLIRYAHADVDAVRASLQCAPPAALLVTDGVFSMDGDVAPLPAIARLCHARAATLVVDDAHGIGVLGGNGGGVVEHFALTPGDVLVLIGTFGKALGVFGAFVAATRTVIEALMQFARPYIYTTALPPGVAAAVSESLRIVTAEPQRRARLFSLIDYFRKRAAARAIPLTSSATPIQPLVIGDSARTVAVGATLRARGHLVGIIRTPTVPAGTARLRVALNAAHREHEVDALVDALAQLL